MKVVTRPGTLGTAGGRRALLTPPFDLSTGGGGPVQPGPAKLRLFPKAGTLATPDGRRALLAPPFTTPTARPPEEVPCDLLNAVKLRFTASTIGEQLEGRIYLDAVGRSAPLPYVEAAEVGATLKLKTSTREVNATRIRFKLYAEGGAEAAGALGDQLEDLFKNARLRFRGGWSTQWVRGDRRHTTDAKRSTAGRQVWCLTVEFTTNVQR